MNRKEKYKSTTRDNPPISLKKPKFKFPEYRKIEICGIDVYLYEDKAQPIANLKMVYPAGSAFEKTWGLASLAAQLLIRGTKNRTAQQIALEADSIGASINSGANWDFCQLNMVFLSDYFDKAFDMFADCLLNPLFEVEEVERAKLKQIANIRQNSSDPDYLAQIAANSSIFHNHPYGHPRLGTEATLANVTSAACSEWYSENSRNPVLFAAGNFDSNLLMDKIEGYFSDKFTNKAQESLDRYIVNEPSAKVVVIDKPGSVQTSVCAGIIAVGRNHPQFPALQLANTVFGGYFLSRLNNLLRQVRGFTYGVHSYINSKNLCSTIMIESSVNADSTALAINDIISEMKKMASEKIPKAELEQARQYSMGSFLRSIESPMQISSMLTAIHQYGLETDYYTNFFNKIAKLTQSEIFEAQKLFFDPAQLVIAASGNSENLSVQLGEFGKVHYCNTEGQISETIS